MRVFTIAFLLNAMFLCKVYSQTDNEICKQIDSTVFVIKNNLESYKLSKTHEGSKGGNKWYREIYQNSNNEVNCIKLNNITKRKTQVVEYYFLKEKLIFAKQTHTSKKGAINSKSHYVNNGFSLKEVNSNGNSIPKNELNLKYGDSLANYAETLIAQFKSM